MELTDILIDLSNSKAALEVANHTIRRMKGKCIRKNILIAGLLWFGADSVWYAVHFRTAGVAGYRLDREPGRGGQFYRRPGDSATPVDANELTDGYRTPGNHRPHRHQCRRVRCRGVADRVGGEGKVARRLCLRLVLDHR